MAALFTYYQPTPTSGTSYTSTAVHQNYATSTNYLYDIRTLQRAWIEQLAYNKHFISQQNIPEFRPQKLTELVKDFLLSGKRPMPGEIERAI